MRRASPRNAPDMAAKAAEIRRVFGEGEIAERAIEETASKHAEGAALKDAAREAEIGLARTVGSGCASGTGRRRA